MKIPPHWLNTIRRFWPGNTPSVQAVVAVDPNTSDDYWMQQALQQARQAETKGEVPVGAVLVKDDILLASGYNQPIHLNDPTAHAEIMVLREAGNTLNNYRLNDTTVYVTLEPCAMCMTAMVHARVKRLVFGANDPARGAVISVLHLADADFLNHRVEYQAGVMAEECSLLLKTFFRRKR